ncbi:MAG: fibrobacter succinogenes major paralogous domain-containing protein [Fibromonadaceae bacterium]|jgi:uncharacterized protein (TIGR02145 family)|nr:fibrobacter succinogenes major paralogous domain-containing protein [Fibromonadaceae bacterium]
MMKKLVGSMVSMFMEVFMWINLVGCALGGLYLGFDAAKSGMLGIIVSMYLNINVNETVLAVLCALGGLVLGTIVGMLFNITFWSISTFQEIRNYSKKWLGKHKTEQNSFVPETITLPDFKQMLADIDWKVPTITMPDFKRILDNNSEKIIIGKKIIISLLSLAFLVGVILIVKNLAEEKNNAYKETKEAKEIEESIVAVFAQQNGEMAEAETIKANGTLTDPSDGKTYKTVKIGSQTWMTENLNIEKGNSVCYDNNPANCQKCGRLYDWETAMKACPRDWHLPSDAEWKVLENAVGGSSIVGEVLKSKSGWDSDGNGTDKHDFSVLPCGRYYNGKFLYYGLLAQFWSATETGDSHALGIGLDARNADMGIGNLNKSLYLRSVRCVKD